MYRHLPVSFWFPMPAKAAGQAATFLDLQTAFLLFYMY